MGGLIDMAFNPPNETFNIIQLSRFQKKIDKYKGEFENTLIFGVPITRLNKEELMATICMLGEMSQDREEELEGRMKIMAELRGARNARR
jgi:hypothetical protein